MIQICTTFCSFVLGWISELQAKKWSQREVITIFVIGVSTTQYLVFLSVKKALNVIPTLPEKQCLKVMDRERKKERWIMYFPIAVNLIPTVSYVNLRHVFIGILCLHLYLWFLLLSMTLFVCHFVPPCEVSEAVVCFTVCTSSFMCHICLPFLIWFEFSCSLRNLYCD